MSRTRLSLEPEALLENDAWLRALAYRLAGPSDAEDAVQETWLTAMQRGPRRSGAARAWLERVLRNAVVSRHRREGGRAPREQEASRRRDVRHAMLREVSAQRTVTQAVLDLEEPFQTVVLLRFYAGLQPAAIAQELGVPAATVRTRLVRGLARLRERLDKAARRDGTSFHSLLMPLLPASGVPQAVAGASMAKGISVGAVIRGGATTALEVGLPSGSATIEGSVRLPSGEPVAGVVVRLLDPEGRRARRRSENTNEQGRCRFAGLVPGEYIVHASKSGFAPGTAVVRVTSKASATITLTAGIDVAFKPLVGGMGPHSARIVDEGGVLVHDDAHAGTRRYGPGFKLRLPERRLKAIIRRPGHEPAVVTFRPTEGEDVHFRSKRKE